MSVRWSRVGLAGYAGGTGLGFLAAALSAGPLAARSDFMSFYSAASLLLQGRGDRIYDLNVLGAQQAILLTAANVRLTENAVALPYPLPPFATLWFLPFALLPLNLAYLLWDGLSAVAVLFAIWRTLRTLGWAPDAAGLGALLGLTYIPSLASLLLGQTSLFLVLVLALAALSLLAGRSRGAGLYLALALFKPQYVVLPLLGLLARRQWRPIAWFAGLALVLAAVGIALAGVTGLIDYISLLRSISAPGGIPTIRPFAMTNWRGMASRLFLEHDPGLAMAMTLAGNALTLLLVVLVWRRGWPDERSTWLARLSALLVAALVVSPHAYPHDAAILILPACWMATLARSGHLHLPAVIALLALGHGLGFISGLFGLRGFADLNVLLALGALAILLWSLRRRVEVAPLLG